MIWVSTVLIGFLSGGAAPPPAPSPQPEMIYRCSARRNLGATGSVVELEKIFGPDGAVQSMSVTWDGQGGGAVRRQGRSDQVSMVLHWPYGRHDTAPGPIDWSTGTISIVYFAQNTATSVRPRRGERWTQVIVDRDDSLSVRDGDPGSFLYIGFGQAGLMGEMRDLTRLPGLDMPLASLLAWGADRETVTVYQVLLSQRGSRDRQGEPLQRRIAARYEVEIGTIARLVPEIRAATLAWEGEIGDFRSTCRREAVLDDNEVVVTDQRVPQPR